MKILINVLVKISTQLPLFMVTIKTIGELDFEIKVCVTTYIVSASLIEMQKIYDKERRQAKSKGECK